MYALLCMELLTGLNWSLAGDPSVCTITLPSNSHFTDVTCKSDEHVSSALVPTIKGLLYPAMLSPVY